jgi:uncharacterized protein (TIGR03545 family)
MRKKFVYFVLLPFVAVTLVVYLFIDRWVEAGLEAAGEKITGAKVEIDHLRLTLSPLGMQWERLQVADKNDPWHNMFETGRVRFAADFGQLLRAKYIIQTMEINSLVLGTKRTTDGSLPKAAADETPPSSDSSSSFRALASQAIDKSVAKTPASTFGLSTAGINTDSLLKALDIHSLKHIDSLKQQATAASQQWDAAMSDFSTSKNRLADIQASVSAIQTSQLSNAAAIVSALQTTDNAIKGVNEIAATFNARRASIENQAAALTASAGAIDDIAADDFARLKGMANLPNLNTTGIARMLVGDEMVKRALTYLHWIDFARSHIKNSSAAPAKENPPRMKGQNIPFPVERAYPKFWVQKVLVSGGTDSAGTDEYIRAQGEILNITNDQGITHVPLTASLSGLEGKGRAFSLKATLDRTKDIPYDAYAATLNGVPLAAFDLGGAGFLGATMTNARMNSSVRVEVPGSNFDAVTTMTLSNFTIRFAREPRNILERIVMEVFHDIQTFQVGLHLWTSGKGFDIAFSTDLDEKISAKAQAVLGAELAGVQNELKAKLTNAIAGKRAEVVKLIADKKAEVEKNLGAVQTLLNDKLSLVNGKKKELTDRLAKENQGKVEDLLKGIIKKP